MLGRITAHDGLKLRKAPGPKALVLDLMPEGDRVELLPSDQAANGWARVRWLPVDGPPLEGWAWAEYIEAAPEPPLISTDRTGWIVATIMAAITLGVLIIYALGG